VRLLGVRKEGEVLVEGTIGEDKLRFDIGLVLLFDNCAILFQLFLIFLYESLDFLSTETEIQNYFLCVVILPEELDNLQDNSLEGLAELEGNELDLN
jgi:hypothetical protein